MSEYEKICYEYAAKLEQGINGQVQMAFPVEWFREEMPLENKNGDALDKVVQDLVDNSFAVSPTFEHVVKPKKDAPQLPEVPPPAKLSVLVFADKLGFTKGIIDAAPEGRIGNKKIVENTYDLDQEEITNLIGKKGWDLVVYGCGMDAPESSAVAHVIEQNTRISESFFYLNKAVLRSATKRLCCITRGTFEDDPKVHKKHGLKITVAGNLFGHCNTSRTEMEETDVQYIDMDYEPKNKEDSFARVASEVFRAGTFGTNTVRVLEKGRYVMRCMSTKKYERANHEWKMPEAGQTILITGGNGALALVMGEWLVEQAARLGKTGFAIQFLSRSMKISDLNAPTWARIQERAAKLGIDVEQARCDISSQEAVDELVKRYTPNLFGWINAAGVLQDSMLMNLSWEKCEAVYDSKHRPALMIHSALERFANPSLEFLWNFSSVAVYGSMGQWNYSGSNAFLDGLSRHRRGRGKVSQTIQWGAWGDVGMAATMDQALRNRIAQGPQPYFSNAEGLAGLEAGLKTGLPYFAVYKMNSQMMFGIVQDTSTSDSLYFRNFYSEIFPTGPAPTLDRKHHYSVVRAAAGLYDNTREALVYDAYVQPRVDQEAKEWGEDFRKWT